MQEPRIVTISDIKLIGKHIQTSLAENKTAELWKSFHPKVKNILNNTGSGLYSIQIFDKDLKFEDFNPKTRFDKWAAVEVDDFNGELPEGLEAYTLTGGKYAVFIHKGLPSDFPETSRFIHTEWLPNSFYELDNRPHFEIMNEDYDPTDPDAEEEVWIPIRQTNIGYDF